MLKECLDDKLRVANLPQGRAVLGHHAGPIHARNLFDESLVRLLPQTTQSSDSDSRPQ